MGVIKIITSLRPNPKFLNVKTVQDERRLGQPGLWCKTLGDFIPVQELYLPLRHTNLNWDPLTSISTTVNLTRIFLLFLKSLIPVSKGRPVLVLPLSTRGQTLY